MDGTEFEGPAALRKALLASHQDAFVRNLTRKVLAYALGRSLTDHDDCLIQQIEKRLATNAFGMRHLVEEIVLSPQFGNR